MKKFSNFNSEEKSQIDIKTHIQKLLKENISVEIKGDEKPWTKDIEVNTDINDQFMQKMEEYINNEIVKSKLELLESVRIAYYNNSILSFIEDNIDKIKNIK